MTYHRLVAVRERRTVGVTKWSAFARLHLLWAGTRFSILSEPPALHGITWSTVNASG